MTDDNAAIDAGSFAPAGYAEWRAVVEAMLQWRSYDDAWLREDEDGLRHEPLATADNTSAPRRGMPGAWTFARGATPLGNAVGGWRVRQTVSRDDPAVAAVEVSAALGGGASAIELAYWGAHDPYDILDLVLTDVDLAQTAIDLDLRRTPDGPAVAAAFLRLLERRGVEPEDVYGALGLDPVGALLTRGSLPSTAEKAVEMAARVAADVAERYPHLCPMVVDLRPAHAAGATRAQCVAMALATGVAYLRALLSAGLSIEAAARRLTFVIPVGQQVFHEAALLRAMRMAWSRVIEASDGDAEACAMLITAVSPWREFSRWDTWTNALRGSFSAIAAALGGADAIDVAPIDVRRAPGVDASNGVDEGAAAMRLARNTQHVLLLEAQLNRVIDPAGGSWHLEELTEGLAKAGWDLFRRIEKAGGIVSVVRDGWLAAEVSAAAAKLEDRVRRREHTLVGTSRFAVPHGGPARANGGAMAAGKGSRRPLVVSGDGDRSESSTAAGERIEPWPRRPVAASWERLRDAAAAFEEATGERPIGLLALLGDPANYLARQTWAQTLLESGGFAVHVSKPILVAEAEARSSAGDAGPSDRAGEEQRDADSAIVEGGPRFLADVATAVAGSLADSRARVVLLCGTDDEYAAGAVEVAAALYSAGARVVALAGRPGSAEAAWRAAGVEHFAYEGADVCAVLEAMLVASGVDLGGVVTGESDDAREGR